jgi:uncharacterized protein (DUF2252 family)
MRPHGQKVVHLTPADRAARGRAERQHVPRGTLATWEPVPDRADPVDVLQSQAETRVQELLPIRYGRMVATPFTFFRGAAAVMAADQATTPRTGLQVQLCGDAHLSNFGIYAAPDRSLVFDINDFDETLPGPWEWDLMRLTASLEIAGRDRGFEADARRDVVLACTRHYRDALREFAEMRNMEVWYARLDPRELLDELEREKASTGKGASRKVLSRVQKRLGKAEAKNHMRAFSKLTRVDDGFPRIISDPPLIVPLGELVEEEERHQVEERLRRVFRAYRESLQGNRRHLLETFRLADMARKVVGVGSVGMRAWIGLALGRDNDDPMFLQFKEAEASVLEPYAVRSRFRNHGRRVVEGQRLTQAASDIMLGWTRVTGMDGSARDYYVRQLWDGKGSADIAQMSSESLLFYSRMCGWTLARAHARSGDRIALAAYLGRNDSVPEAMARFAGAYADQNELDHAELRTAIKKGRVAAEEGV